MKLLQELLQHKQKIARKDHICNYCGEVIHKGEIYKWAKLKSEGLLYEWKCHIMCCCVADELWSYIDPDDGMTEYDFKEGCSDFCQTFVCPDCSQYDNFECRDDRSYCVEKIYDFLLTHELYRERKGWYEIWKCREKQTGGKGDGEL